MQQSVSYQMDNGWKPDEIALLQKEIDICKSEGEKLKSAFEKVSHDTGRSVNSIRNYYYSYMKESEDQEQSKETKGKDNKKASKSKKSGSSAAAIDFIPFTEEEKWELMINMLEAQGNGRSVRGCALEMGSGDKSRMLRYQNKYRNLLKSDPTLVHNVMKQLEEEGRPYVNPYDKKESKEKADVSSKAQPEDSTIKEETAEQKEEIPEEEVQQYNFVDIISGIVRDVESLQNQDVVSLFEGLHSLTRLAARQLYSRKKAEEYDRLTVKYDLLVIEAEKMEKEMDAGKEREAGLQKIIDERDVMMKELKSQALMLNNRIESQKENTNRLMTMFRQLISLNRSFLGLNPVNKVSNLNHYTMQLHSCMEEYEKLIHEYE